ncbi:hypothetical protein Acr_29g0002340 [Actinidia rufa]|uniref:Uncharacterized protein n=1 Tax=Actinidia rufa TaxID=165716 RepID=A0A7J0HDJ7_9ERIC|nr:hypothetical protein Acr_29g0002340 [Actinidia rufa]
MAFEYTTKFVSSRQAPAPNGFQIGVQTSPHASFEVRHVRSTHPMCARGRRRLDFTRHALPRARELTHTPARATDGSCAPVRASTRANAPHAPPRTKRVAATLRHAPTRPANPSLMRQADTGVSLSQARDYSGGTNERVPKATERGQKKRPEKRSRERGHRGQEKRRDKKNCPRNKAQDQSSEAATTTMMAVDESDVLLAASADEGSDWISDSGIAYHLCRDREIRSNEALKLVEEHSKFPRETGNAAREGRLKGYTDWKGMSRQEELLSDIGQVVLARRMDEESNRCTEARKASAGIPEGCT